MKNKLKVFLIFTIVCISRISGQDLGNFPYMETFLSTQQPAGVKAIQNSEFYIEWTAIDIGRASSIR